MWTINPPVVPSRAWAQGQASGDAEQVPGNRALRIRTAPHYSNLPFRISVTTQTDAYGFGSAIFLNVPDLVDLPPYGYCVTLEQALISPYGSPTSATPDLATAPLRLSVTLPGLVRSVTRTADGSFVDEPLLLSDASAVLSTADTSTGYVTTAHLHDTRSTGSFTHFLDLTSMAATVTPFVMLDTEPLTNSAVELELLFFPLSYVSN